MDKIIDFPTEFGTRFCVTVDTEEEFAWGAELSRDGHGVSSVPALREGQAYFQAAKVIPLYYVDKPVLDSDVATEIFREWIDDKSADFGVHLHPWVTPPFDEFVSRANSYAGNLPEEMERAKLVHVRDLMIERIGVRPIAYRAGRYGIGPNSYRILAEEGFRIDSSVRSLFDYRDDGGPDFRWNGHRPYFVGADQQIAELPLTSMFIGHASAVGRSVYGRLGHIGLARSILARSGLVSRIPLTPEGVPSHQVCDAIDVACDLGIQLLTMSFHSPSLAVGHTPYVRSAADLAAFYRWFDIVLGHCAKRGINSVGLEEISAAVDCARAVALAKRFETPLSRAGQVGPVAQLVRAGRS